MTKQYGASNITIPEWFKVTAPDAMLDSKEVKQIFGYKATGCVIQAANRGIFPQPDKVFLYKAKGINNKRYLWKKSTILLEIKRRQNL